MKLHHTSNRPNHFKRKKINTYNLEYFIFTILIGTNDDSLLPPNNKILQETLFSTFCIIMLLF